MLPPDMSFTPRQQEILQEIGSICAGNAATALSQVINRPISMNVPRVLFVRVEEVPAFVGSPDVSMVAVVLRVLGDCPGALLFLFSRTDAALLARVMTNAAIESPASPLLSAMEQSALKEAGSIVAAAYLTALSSFTAMGMIPTPPLLVCDMAGALVDYMLIELAATTTHALVIDSEFLEERLSVRGHFFLLPNPASLQAIMRAIEAFYG